MKWAPQFTEEMINIVKNGKTVLNGVIDIMSYELAATFAKKKSIVNKKYKIVIVDESHYLKNYKAKRTQEITPVIRDTPRAILLSGTPALSRPSELFPQLNAINCKLFPNFFSFAERYCDGHPGDYGYKADGLFILFSSLFLF